MKLDSKIFLLDMFLIVGGEGSSNRNASRDESVEAGDKSVEAGDESIEAGEKTLQSCYNVKQLPEPMTNAFNHECLHPRLQDITSVHNLVPLELNRGPLWWDIPCSTAVT